LDGLRLLAVAGVLAFHYGVPGARAGFLGVDLFFVLSGYLITSLLLSELQHGRVRLGQFWTRRARRLVPALVPVVVAMLVWGAVFAPAVLRDRLRADIASTLFYFANWHFIASSSYFASDGVRSPLEHMWSLALEEQFYVLWPLLLAFVGLGFGKPRHRLFAVGVLAAAGIAFSAWRLESLWSSSGVDRAYLGTDSRIFEPLAGGLLAVALTSPRVRRLSGRLHWPLLFGGVAGWAWAMTSLGGAGGAATAYFHGGALVVAASTTAVIAALSTGASRSSRALAARPVAYLGRLSYGIYLWHWPLWVWTQPGGWVDLTGLGKPLQVALLTLTTVALAAASYTLVESPVRYGRVAKLLAPRRTLVVLSGTLLALFVVSDTTVVPYAGAALGQTTRTIVLVGDSVPQRLAPDFAAAAATHGYVVISATRGSCPATGVALVNSRGKPWGPGPLCATDVPARQDAAVASYRPALVIWWSRYELADRVDARGRPVRFASPAYWMLQKQAFDRRATALTRNGAILVAVQIERSGLGIRTRCRPSACGPFLARLVHDATAQNTWNAFLASHRSGKVRSISIQTLVCHDTRTPCNDRLPNGQLARPDGTHYQPAAASIVARAVIDRSLIVAHLAR
jgi:peptidoglycan/LPS O-acetylase OafA/YrhL